MNRHLHALGTPRGRVMYTHHDIDRLADGVDGFLSDGYLLPRDGSSAVPLPMDELLDIITTCGTGEMVRLALMPNRSSVSAGLGSRVAEGG